MRISKTSTDANGLKVNAIAGTYTVILAFTLPEEKCEGLLGFSIHRKDHKENESYYLKGMKAFEATDPGFPSGSLYSTKDHPIQSFQWADYSAKPGYKYTYTLTALKGTPQVLKAFSKVKVVVTTESPEMSKHDVYFNRGTAASQEYVRRFGNLRPEDVPNNKAFEWLSRGLYEALENFVNSCVPQKHALRIAAYEFHYPPFLTLLKNKIDSGLDIQIVYDARDDDGPKEKNRAAVAAAGLQNACKERTEGKSYISHNKFIVKLDNNNPISVWTGGTNFSVGGIFGHSNVAHVVEDNTVAQNFLDFWQLLAQNPKMTDAKNHVEILTPLPTLPLTPESTCLFSPRKNLDALNFYKKLALTAQSGLFMTFAFGINDLFKEVYNTSTATLRFALLESKTRAMKAGPLKDAEENKIDALRRLPENVFAIGNFIKTNAFDGWVIEKLTGLNNHVKYVHNKFMMIDPLGNKPIIIVGSANFSNASTTDNDENMVIISGNSKVADIYLGEFMRLFSHFSFRESLHFRDPDDRPKFLRTDDWWRDNFGNTPRANRRQFFTQF